MTFDELWPTLAIPGEYDAMDETDRARWRNVIRHAFEADTEDVKFLHTQVKFWHTIADARAAEVCRLMDELRRLREELTTLRGG